MLTKEDSVIRREAVDLTLTDVICQALADNLVRIPFSNEGGYIATEIGEQEDPEFLTIRICGFMYGSGQMLQQVTVIYFDTVELARRFISSPEGALFDDSYSTGQDCFDYTTYAGSPHLPFLITTILKNYFGYKDNSHLVAHTYCHVDYFRKDSGKTGPVKS